MSTIGTIAKSADKLSDKMKSSRRSAGLPFELSIESLSEADRYLRAQDEEGQKKFNTEVKQWIKESVQALRVSVKSLVRNDKKLSASIVGKPYYDRTYGNEVNRVGFTFAREGIYLHKGAGRGQGGLTGSTWLDKHGTRKSRDPESAGKQGEGNRPEKEWFDPVISDRLPQLADIIADYSATMQLNAAQIFINKVAPD